MCILQHKSGGAPASITDRLPPIHFFLDVAPRNLFPVVALNVASSGPLDGSYLKRFFKSRMGMTLREWRSSH